MQSWIRPHRCKVNEMFWPHGNISVIILNVYEFVALRLRVQCHISVQLLYLHYCYWQVVTSIRAKRAHWQRDTGGRGHSVVVVVLSFNGEDSKYWSSLFRIMKLIKLRCWSAINRRDSWIDVRWSADHFSVGACWNTKTTEFLQRCYRVMCFFVWIQTPAAETHQPESRQTFHFNCYWIHVNKLQLIWWCLLF